jgi:hypothetical protein
VRDWTVEFVSLGDKTLRHEILQFHNLLINNFGRIGKCHKILLINYPNMRRILSLFVRAGKKNKEF